VLQLDTKHSPDLIRRCVINYRQTSKVEDERRRHLEDFSSVFPEINFVFARSLQFHKRLLKFNYHPTKSEGRMKAAEHKRSYRQCHL